MEYSTETQVFFMQLEQARDKLITQWGDKELDRLTQDILQSNENNLQLALLEKKRYAEKLADIQHKCQANKKALQEHRSEVTDLKSQLAVLNTMEQDRLADKQLVEADIAQTSKDILMHKQVLQEFDKTVSSKVKDLQKAGDLFKDGLGLSFKKTSGSRMQVVFTDIDDRDRNAKYYFYVKIQDGKYIVSDCEPHVDNFNFLVDKLNATNNFRSFVIAVRKSFKQLSKM